MANSPTEKAPQKKLVGGLVPVKAMLPQAMYEAIWEHRDKNMQRWESGVIRMIIQQWLEDRTPKQKSANYRGEATRRPSGDDERLDEERESLRRLEDTQLPESSGYIDNPGKSERATKRRGRTTPRK